MASTIPECEYGEPEGEGEPGGEPEGEPGGEPEGESEGICEEVVGLAELSSVAEQYSYTIVFALLLIAIVSLNSVTLYKIRKHGFHRKSPMYVYTMSVLLSSLVLGGFVIPGRMIGIFSKTFLTEICQGCHYITEGCYATIGFTTVLMAFVKYREVILHHGHLKISYRRAYCEVAAVWILGHIYAIRAPVTFGVIPVNDIAVCTIKPQYETFDHYFLFVDAFILLMVPFVLVIGAYWKLKLFCVKAIYEVQRSNVILDSEKQIQSWEHESSELPRLDNLEIKVDGLEAREEPLDIDEQYSPSQQKRDIQMMAIEIIAFVLSTIFPYFPRICLYWFEGADYYPTFDMVAWIISYCSAWISPVIILAYHQELRVLIFNMFKR